MEEKVRIIQTSNTSMGTVISLSSDVSQIEVTFTAERSVSRVVIKMKSEERNIKQKVLCTENK